MILPSPTNPPTPVQVSWIDANSDSDYEGSGTDIGELVEIRQVGYHIRNGRDTRLGDFAVLVVDWSENDGDIQYRAWTAIPAGWIIHWSALVEKDTIHATPQT